MDRRSARPRLCVKSPPDITRFARAFDLRRFRYYSPTYVPDSRGRYIVAEYERQKNTRNKNLKNYR